MKKYIAILLLLALLFFIGKRLLGKSRLLTVGAQDWDGKKIAVNVNGRSFLIEPKKDFNNVVIGDYVLSTGTFGNTVVVSLKKNGEAVENLEVDFDERTIV